MKNQLLTLAFLSLLTLTGCKEAPVEKIESTEQKELPDYATFEKNAAVLAKFLKAHSDEDIDAQAALLSDTLKWSPPHFNGNKWLGKEDYLAVLKNYHDNFENIKYTEGIILPNTVGSGNYAGSVYPKDIASSVPNSIRQYGTWTATHTASQKEIGVKWYAISSVHENGKIHMISEYFDANGIAVQISSE